MEEEKHELADVKTNRKVGAPLGNQNARKHGFYSNVLTQKERRNLRKAVDFESLDSEISLLRVKIISVIENEPDNLDLIVRAVNTLRKMLATRKIMVRQDEDAEARKGEQGDIKQAVRDVLKDIVPVGDGIESVPQM